MLLGGLWHGAAWTFIVWGGLHGSYLILERLQRKYLPFKITKYNGIFLAFITFSCVNITWVFFRADTFKKSWDMIKSMFYAQFEGEKILGNFDIIVTCTVIGLMFLCHWFMRNSSLKTLAQKTPAWALGLTWAILFFLIVISQGSGEQFIYFQF
jgi:alginate O-acetyltransferase complex protein AlgI